MLLTLLSAVNESDRKDIDIWKSLLEGDREALSWLFRKYYAPLLNYGLKLIPKKALVKDSIQEVYASIWEKRSQLSEVEYVRSYLYISLRRRLYRLAEQQDVRSRRDIKYSEEIFHEIVDKEQAMIRDERKKEKKKLLYDALTSLSKRQKEAIFLKFYCGLTNSEIAQVMEVNKQSVYNYIFRAISSLQQYMGATLEVN